MANLTFAHGIIIGLSAGLVGALVVVALVPWSCPRLSFNAIASKLSTLDRRPLQERTASGPDVSDPVTSDPTAFTSREEGPATSGAPIGKPISRHIVREPVPKRPYEPNPIWKNCMSLPQHIEPMRGPKCVHQVCSFEHRIEQFGALYIRVAREAATSVPEALFDEDQLVRLAGGPANGGTWSESISNPLKRRGAVMCFLAQVLYKRMHPRCGVEESLLPPEVSTCYHYLNQLTNLSWAKLDYLAVWREVVYVALRGAFEIRRYNVLPFEEGDPRTERTNAMVPEIMNALKLDSLIDRDFSLEQAKVSLEATFQSAANGALVLLGQSCEWEAVWASDDPGFINFPELQFIWIDKVKFSRPVLFDSDTSLRLGDFTQEEHERYKERDLSRMTAL
ncbi:hypothetical protein ACHAPT_012548 [Fusarium lateritium]